LKQARTVKNRAAAKERKEKDCMPSIGEELREYLSAVPEGESPRNIKKHWKGLSSQNWGNALDLSIGCALALTNEERGEGRGAFLERLQAITAPRASKREGKEKNLAWAGCFRGSRPLGKA